MSILCRGQSRRNLGRPLLYESGTILSQREASKASDWTTFAYVCKEVRNCALIQLEIPTTVLWFGHPLAKDEAPRHLLMSFYDLILQQRGRNQ